MLETNQALRDLKASTNLIHWDPVFTTDAPGLPFNWNDPEYGQAALRFYRIRLGPQGVEEGGAGTAKLVSVSG